MKMIKNKSYGSSKGGFDAGEFGKMLEQAYIDGGRESKHTTKKSFSPSGFYGSGQCPRYWYMAFEGANFDNSNDAISIANMSNGTDSHERIQAAMERTGKLVETEREVNLDSPPIRGFVDCIIEWEGELVVGEIKTTRQETFAVRVSTMSAPGYQLIQLLIYMKVLGIDKGFMLYENKNTHEIIVLPVLMTDGNKKLVDATFEWMEVVFKSWQDEVRPMRVFTEKSKECKGCVLREDCYKAPEGKVLIKALELPR